jgi:hypothetical protein
MGIGIILITVMPILLYRSMGSKFLQPYLIIMMQPRFVIIDKNVVSNSHKIEISNT